MDTQVNIATRADTEYNSMYTVFEATINKDNLTSGDIMAAVAAVDHDESAKIVRFSIRDVKRELLHRMGTSLRSPTGRGFEKYLTGWRISDTIRKSGLYSVDNSTRITRFIRITEGDAR